MLLPQELVVVEQVEKDETLHDVSEPFEEFGDQADDIGSSVVKDDDDKQHASQGKRMRKYTKRGRALKREHSTSLVPWFVHETHPLLIQEIVSFLGAAVVIFGTPAGGLGFWAIIEMGTSCIAFARNEKHATLLESKVGSSLAEKMCQFGSAMCVAPLARRLMQLGAPGLQQAKCLHSHIGSSDEEDGSGSKASASDSPRSSQSDTSKQSQKAGVKRKRVSNALAATTLQKH